MNAVTGKNVTITERIEKGIYSGKPCAFWFWNEDAVNMDDEQIREVMKRCADEIGYGGFAIIPNRTNDYLSDVYFSKYRVAVKTAEELGMNICIYDENGFPSGAANGAYAERYPEHTVKRLDKLEWDIEGGHTIDMNLDIPGVVMGIVLMNNNTKECCDVTHCYSNGKISLLPEDGRWKLMVFVCVNEGSPIADYLSKEAVDKFIEMTHEAYYREFSDYFGNVIDSFFYDEPSMWGFEGEWIPGGRIVTEGRMWTPEFNTFYEKNYGESPILSYPALWYDIGESTEDARRKLFECRAEMFNRHYIRNMADWCEERGVLLTGHTWEENILNPTGTVGDLMKVFKYQHIPGIDSIFNYQFVKNTLKVVSSSAYNWDKQLVMCETFGAMPEDERLRHVLYKETMDLYAKGINYIVPHAVWYGVVGTTPDLSYQGPYADVLPDVMSYITCLNQWLQGGRHVADIAVLYPIEDMQSKFCFTQPNDECLPPYSNYIEIGEKLSCDYRLDFTYLHPEVLKEKCHVNSIGRTLCLDNKCNYEEYKVLIFPAMEMVSIESIKKAEEFYQHGGAVIFCEKLPNKTVHPTDKQEMINILAHLFENEKFDEESIYVKSNSNGGHVGFIPANQIECIGELLKKICPNFDVEIKECGSLEDGTLTYIHKVRSGKHIYFFANSSVNEIHTTVRVRGRSDLECVNPHSGEVNRVSTVYRIYNGVEYTEFNLNLQPESSMFYVTVPVKREKK